MKNFKRILALVLTIMFVVTSCASLSAVNNPTKWYMNAVNWIQDTGVDTIETAEDKIDRDTFVTWVAKIESTFVDDTLWHDEVASTVFTDVTTDNHRAAIAYSAQRGFIIGNGDGTFAPDRILTFAEACAVLVRAVGYDIYVTDKSPANWAYNYVMMATNRCRLVDSTWVKNVGAYVPEHEMTKGEAAYLLYTAAGLTTDDPAKKAVTVIYSSTIDNSSIKDTGKRLGEDLARITSTETVIIVDAARAAINANAKTSWNNASFGTAATAGNNNFAEQYFLTWGTPAFADDAAGWILKWTPSTDLTEQVAKFTAKQFAKTNYKTTNYTYGYSKNLEAGSKVLVQRLVNNVPSGAAYELSAADVQKYLAKSVGLTESSGKLFKADGSAAYFFDYADVGTVLTITRKVSDNSISAIAPAAYYTVDTYRVWTETTNADLYNAGLANKLVASGAATTASMNAKYDAEKDVTSWTTVSGKPVLNFQGKSYNIVDKYSSKASDLMVFGFVKTDVTNAAGDVEWHSTHMANINCFVPAGVTPYCFYLAEDGVSYLTEAQYEELVESGTVDGAVLKTYAVLAPTDAENAILNNSVKSSNINSYYAKEDKTADQQAAVEFLNSRDFYKYHLFDFAINGGESFVGAKKIESFNIAAQLRRVAYLMTEVDLTADKVIFGAEKSTRNAGYTPLSAAAAKALIINAVEGEITTLYTDLDGDGAYDIAVVNSVNPFEVCETLNVDDKNGEYKGIPSYGSLFANRSISAQSGVNTDAFYLAAKNTGKVQLYFHESGRGGMGNEGDGYYDYNTHTNLDYNPELLIDVATMSTGYIKTVSTVAANGYYDAIIVTDVDGVATEVAVKIPAFGYVPTTQALTYSAFGATTTTTFNSTAWMTFVTDYYDSVYENYYTNAGDYLYTVKGTNELVALSGKDAYAYAVVDGVACPVTKATYDELEAQTKLVGATEFGGTEINYYYNDKGTATVPAGVVTANNVGDYYRYYAVFATSSDLATEDSFVSADGTVVVTDTDYYYRADKDNKITVDTWEDGVGYWFDNGTQYIKFTTYTDVETPEAFQFSSQTDFYFKADGSTITYFKKITDETFDSTKTYYSYAITPVTYADYILADGVVGMHEVSVITEGFFSANKDKLYIKVTEASHKYADEAAMSSITTDDKYIKVDKMVEIEAATDFAYLASAKKGAVATATDYDLYYNEDKTATVAGVTADDCADYYRYVIKFDNTADFDEEATYYYNADKADHVNFETNDDFNAASATDWFVGTKKTDGYSIVDIKVGTSAKGFKGQDSALAIVLGDKTYNPTYFLNKDANKGIDSKTDNEGTMAAAYMTGKYIQYVLDAKNNVILAFDSAAATNVAATGFVVAVTKSTDNNTYTITLDNKGLKSYNVRANASYLLDIANVKTYANIYSGNLINTAYTNGLEITGESFNYVKMTEDDGAYSVLTTIAKNQTWTAVDSAVVLSSAKNDALSGAPVQDENYAIVYDEIIGTDPTYVAKVNNSKVTFDVKFGTVSTRTKTVAYTKVIESVTGGQYVPVVDSNGDPIVVKANEAADKYDNNGKHYVAIDGKLYWEVVAGTYNYVKITKSDAYTSKTYYSDPVPADLADTLSSYKNYDKKSMAVLSATAMKKTESGYIPGYYFVTFNGNEYKASGAAKITMMVPSSKDGKVVCQTTTIKEIADNGAVLFATEAIVNATGNVLSGITVIGEVVDQTVVIVTPDKPTEKVVYVSPDTATVADIDETGSVYYVKTSKAAYAIDGTEFGSIFYAYDTNGKDFLNGTIVTTIEPGAFYAVKADGTIKEKVATLYSTKSVEYAADIADGVKYAKGTYTVPCADVNILDTKYIGSATITSIKDNKIVATVNGAKNTDITDWNVEFIYTDVDGKALYLAGDAVNVSINTFDGAVESQATAYKTAKVRSVVYDTVKNSSDYSDSFKTAMKDAVTAANEALATAKETIATKFFNGQFWGTGLLTASPLGVYFNKVANTFNKSALVSFNFVEADGVYYVIVPTFVISAQ